MPYLAEGDRQAVDELVEKIREASIAGAGTLNYLFTQICIAYLAEATPARYIHMNDLIGALECAKLELYRRLVVPYEETKIAQNGDVYPEAR
jgi:hypothetical protein